MDSDDWSLCEFKQITSSDFCTSMDLLISVSCIALKEADKMVGFFSFLKWREIHVRMTEAPNEHQRHYGEHNFCSGIPIRASSYYFFEQWLQEQRLVHIKCTNSLHELPLQWYCVEFYYKHPLQPQCSIFSSDEAFSSFGASFPSVADLSPSLAGASASFFGSTLSSDLKQKTKPHIMLWSHLTSAFFAIWHSCANIKSLLFFNSISLIWV